MGLLTKGKESFGAVETVTEKGAINSILDEEMSIVGDVFFKGKARIDGKVEGNVQGAYLILSQSGIIKGNIEADVIICQGLVEGNIKAERLHAQTAAKINGSLDVADLTVDSGASLSGDIQARSQDLRLVHKPALANEKEEEARLLTNA